MALNTKELIREFIIEKSRTVLQDPNPAMTPDQVMNHYSSQHSELTTATVHGPTVENDKMIYKFKTTVGTKG
ncbi:PRTRC genetic system protein C [Dysgonomonas hofstadii]|uniref:PRTRC genetic system protein C n=1 Tax=Dysgonomonas hofstadii TaxID=637886 RepID=A0A840CNB0_9BACT|nr:PRTRC system protein C [Dysgonomonas hofstadii]MBB4036591.1 PRTRC genetic system protein C [Dysgonomonas hofstadii]